MMARTTFSMALGGFLEEARIARRPNLKTFVGAREDSHWAAMAVQEIPDDYWHFFLFRLVYDRLYKERSTCGEPALSEDLWHCILHRSSLGMQLGGRC